MKVNALQVRQSLGRILEKLKKTEETIIIEKGREPVAVLISLRIFKERFIDYREEQKRPRAPGSFPSQRSKSSVDSLAVLRKLRYGSDH